MLDQKTIAAEMTWRGLIGTILVTSRWDWIKRAGAKLIAREVMYRARKHGLSHQQMLDSLQRAIMASRAEMGARHDRPKQEG